MCGRCVLGCPRRRQVGQPGASRPGRRARRDAPHGRHGGAGRHQGRRGRRPRGPGRPPARDSSPPTSSSSRPEDSGRRRSSSARESRASRGSSSIPFCASPRRGRAPARTRDLPMPFYVQKDGYILSPYFDHLSYFFNRDWRPPAGGHPEPDDQARGRAGGKGRWPPGLQAADRRGHEAPGRGRGPVPGGLRPPRRPRGGASSSERSTPATREAPCPSGPETAASLHDPRLPGNLYVADATLLPRALGAPPILTIMALARKVARPLRLTAARPFPSSGRRLFYNRQDQRRLTMSVTQGEQGHHRHPDGRRGRPRAQPGHPRRDHPGPPRRLPGHRHPAGLGGPRRDADGTRTPPNHEHYLELTEEVVNKAGRTGGTFLHTSRTRPSARPGRQRPRASPRTSTRTRSTTSPTRSSRTWTSWGSTRSIPIGGDDTLSYGVHLHHKGVKVIAIPKTMDNDVPGTDYCIGFSTCVTRTIEMTHALRTTAGSHERFLVIEVFGRYAGFTALLPTMAGAANRCLIPEAPFNIETLCELLTEDRSTNPSHYSVVLVSEGRHVRGRRHGLRERREGHVRPQEARRHRRPGLPRPQGAARRNSTTAAGSTSSTSG